MTKQKLMIALGGAALAVASIANPGVFGIMGVIAGATLILSIVLVPMLALVVNPLVDAALNSKFGEAIGAKGRTVFKALFYIPVGNKNVA